MDHEPDDSLSDAEAKPYNADVAEALALGNRHGRRKAAKLERQARKRNARDAGFDAYGNPIVECWP